MRFIIVFWLGIFVLVSCGEFVQERAVSTIDHRNDDSTFAEAVDSTTVLYSAQSLMSRISQIILDLRKNRHQGVGVISGSYTAYNLYARSPNLTIRDSLYFYDKPNGKAIGYIPWVNKSMFIYGAKYFSDSLSFLYLGENDINTGLASLEYIKVYEKKGSWVRVFELSNERGPMWIDLDQLFETHEFLAWKDYFKSFPNGNEGWQKGYSWVGLKGYLYDSPDLNSDRIVEIPENAAIYLKDEFEGNWAKVQLKVVDHLFNANGSYTGKDEELNVWTGWLPMTNIYGYPNLEEIILGC